MKYYKRQCAARLRLLLQPEHEERRGALKSQRARSENRTNLTGGPRGCEYYGYSRLGRDAVYFGTQVSKTFRNRLIQLHPENKRRQVTPKCACYKT
jgi:hypothetical protein